MQRPSEANGPPGDSIERPQSAMGEEGEPHIATEAGQEDAPRSSEGAPLSDDGQASAQHPNPVEPFAPAASSVRSSQDAPDSGAAPSLELAVKAAVPHQPPPPLRRSSTARGLGPSAAGAEDLSSGRGKPSASSDREESVERRGDARVVATPTRSVGRYLLFNELASGGMATVHVGRLMGASNFARTVAIKRLHPQYARNAEFCTMFLDEARLASRIQHANVVSVRDVLQEDGELFLVMDYVPGEALSRILRNALRQKRLVPFRVITKIVHSMLLGLHAAHEARGANGERLDIVHRDISPQNLLVGVDGVCRLLDFGVAKAAMRAGHSKDGQMKGKLRYMSPEQFAGIPLDRRSDIFAAGIVLWEALCSLRLFAGDDAAQIMGKVVNQPILSPCDLISTLPDKLSSICLKALERSPKNRYQTALEFAVALESVPMATTQEVSQWVINHGDLEFYQRLACVAQVEAIPVAELKHLSEAERELRTSAGLSTAAHLGDELSDDFTEVDVRKPAWRSRRLGATLALIAVGILIGSIIAPRWLSPERWSGSTAGRETERSVSSSEAMAGSPSADEAMGSSSGVAGSGSLLDTRARAVGPGASSAMIDPPADVSPKGKASGERSPARSTSALGSTATASGATLDAKKVINRQASNRAQQTSLTTRGKPRLRAISHPNVGCERPYRVDHRGIRMPKTECL